MIANEIISYLENHEYCYFEKGQETWKMFLKEGSLYSILVSEIGNVFPVDLPTAEKLLLYCDASCGRLIHDEAGYTILEIREWLIANPERSLYFRLNNRVFALAFLWERMEDSKSHCGIAYRPIDSSNWFAIEDAFTFEELLSLPDDLFMDKNCQVYFHHEYKPEVFEIGDLVKVTKTTSGKVKRDQIYEIKGKLGFVAGNHWFSLSDDGSIVYPETSLKLVCSKKDRKDN